MTEANNVTFNPNSFSDDAGLLDMSMEDVVALFLDREKHRAREAKDDENQQEDLVGYRVVPMGLLMSLDASARHLNITRSLLTRCLSHQIMSWIESIARIRELMELFNIAHDAANEHGYPDLYDGMRPTYVFANTSPKQMSFRTIRWVKNGLAVLSQPLGVPTGALFIVGLCFALSTSEDSGSKGTIRKYFSVEVSQLAQHVEEQFIRVSGFHDMVRRRVAANGSDNTIT